MHLFAPELQAVGDHFLGHWVRGIQRITAAGVIGAMEVFIQRIKRIIIDAAKANHRSVIAAFRRMVIDHIQNYFDMSFMQRFDHIAELVYHAEVGSICCIFRMRCKKSHGAVAPVITFPRTGILWIELKYRQ